MIPPRRFLAVGSAADAVGRASFIVRAESSRRQPWSSGAPLFLTLHTPPPSRPSSVWSQLSGGPSGWVTGSNAGCRATWPLCSFPLLFPHQYGDSQPDARSCCRPRAPGTLASLPPLSAPQPCSCTETGRAELEPPLRRRARRSVCPWEGRQCLSGALIFQFVFRCAGPRQPQS